jgi:PAS domain S-box-containing protein
LLAPGAKKMRSSVYQELEKRLEELEKENSNLRKAVEFLEESEEKYKELVNLLPQIVFETDKKGNITFANYHALDLLGYTPGDIGKGLNVIEIIVPPDKRNARRHMRKVMKGLKLDGVEYVVQSKDGRTFSVLSYYTSIIHDNKPVGLRGIAIDLTERKRTENLMRIQRDLSMKLSTATGLTEGLRLCLETALQTSELDCGGVYLVDETTGALDLAFHQGLTEAFITSTTHYEADSQNTKLVMAGNPVFSKYEDLGIPLDEPGKREHLKAIGVIPISHYGRVIGCMNIASHTLEEVPVFARAALETIAAQIGSVITHLQAEEALKESEKKAEEERRKLEEQLFQAQKMESIGRLAGGIAHDFNNILTSIMGYAELLKFKLTNSSTREKQAADIIIKSSERASDLTRQLLAFARSGKYNPVPLMVNDIIKQTIIVSEKIFEKKIEVKYDLEEKLKPIEADRNQLDQVLTNIIINAKDAMPNGGELIFTTANVYLDEEYTDKFQELIPGDYVKISIKDTGMGMPRSIKDRIFEPFFTTKGAGCGTGLGLATVYGIIKNHNGQISCTSEPGKGTTFTIYLPATEKEIITEENETAVIKGEETILLVDDEEYVRDVAKRQLERLGYKAITANDGIDAVDIYKKKKKKIDLVLLDMVMPNLAGKETFRELKNINPDIKVILISGFSRNGRAAEIIKEGALAFLQKPFKLYELSKALAGVLRK